VAAVLVTTVLVVAVPLVIIPGAGAVLAAGVLAAGVLAAAGLGGRAVRAVLLGAGGTGGPLRLCDRRTAARVTDAPLGLRARRAGGRRAGVRVAGARPQLAGRRACARLRRAAVRRGAWAVPAAGVRLQDLQFPLADVDEPAVHASALAQPVDQLRTGRSLVPPALHTAGALALARGEVAEAERCFAEILRTASCPAAIPGGLEGLAVVCADADPERALRLAGAAHALRDGAGGCVGSYWRARVAAALDAARDGLGRPAADASWNAGTRLSPEQAVVYARHEVWTDPKAAPPGRPVLTARELEVSALVADGLTNRQIARCLKISPRTVEAHLDHVRTKLGLNSRAQVAAWSARQDRSSVAAGSVADLYAPPARYEDDEHAGRAVPVPAARSASPRS
jgi:DNA-binding CsgD family transcriptional regulator